MASTRIVALTGSPPNGAGSSKPGGRLGHTSIVGRPSWPQLPRPMRRYTAWLATADIEAQAVALEEFVHVVAEPDVEATKSSAGSLSPVHARQRAVAMSPGRTHSACPGCS
jgi:hypothetical protein